MKSHLSSSQTPVRMLAEDEDSMISSIGQTSAVEMSHYGSSIRRTPQSFASNELKSKENKVNTASATASMTTTTNTKTAGMDEAFQVVHAILEQVTLNDSPPVNDDIPSSKKQSPSPRRRNKHDSPNRSIPASSSTVSTGASSKASRIPPIYENSTNESASSLHSLSFSASRDNRTVSSHTTSSDSKKSEMLLGDLSTTSSSYVDSSIISVTASQVKMGHGNLATLCNRTLDSMVSTQQVANISVPISFTPKYTRPQSENGHADNSSAAFSQNNTSFWDAKEWHANSELDGSTSSGAKKRWLSARRKQRKEKGNYDAVDLDLESPRNGISCSSLAGGIDRKEYAPLSVAPDGPSPLPDTPRSETEDQYNNNNDDDDDVLYNKDNRGQLEPPTPVRANTKHVSTYVQLNFDTGSIVHTKSEDNGLEDVFQQKEDDNNTEQVMDAIENSRSADEGDSHYQGGTPQVLEIPTPNAQPVSRPKVFQPIVIAPPTNQDHARIKMFGSEYARFLSSTPFAPTISKTKMHGSKSSYNRGNKSPSSYKKGGKSFNIEDANDHVQTGAITDIVVTHEDDLPPKGYYRISQTGSGRDFMAFLQQESGKLGRKTKKLYLNIKKEPNWDRAAQRPCVTSLALIFPDKNEFVPPGFSVVRRYGEKPTEGSDEHNPANLNFGLSDEPVFLCYRRSREGNPITGIVPLQPAMGEAVPEGYTVLERTPRNFVANLHGKGGAPVFLAFRQRLATLETLRPLPLVLSIHYAAPPGNSNSSLASASAKKKKRLRAYYCTGGTVVSSEVGRFHIMDRSTHSLLSPSSVSNRLSLIEASRKQHQSTDAADLPRKGIPSANTYASSIASDKKNIKFMNAPNTRDIFKTRSDDSRSIHSRDRSFSTMSDLSYSEFGDIAAQPDESSLATYSTRRSVFTHEDRALQSCFDAMNFIPPIEVAEIPNADNSLVILQARIAVLTPTLTACYTYHGGSALVAVEGLTALLENTDFFKPDIAVSDEGKSDTSSRLTLLDLATQAVCDVATSSSREAIFGPCVEFVESAVRRSQGQLNVRTIGFVLRFYLFVFYFGASVPTGGSSWPNKINSQTNQEQEGNASGLPYLASDVPLLFDENSICSFLQGGAPQAASLALKELTSLILKRLGEMSKQKCVENIVQGCMAMVISASVENTAHQIDISNHVQLVLHQIHRSGGSELFWHDMMTSCGVGLFDNDPELVPEGKQIYILCFALLASLVKAASSKVRRVSQAHDLLPRDVGNKLLNLELMLHFLEKFGEEESALKCDGNVSQAVQSIQTMVYSIRRLVVPCLLWNTESGLEEIRVFRRIMCIITTLWKTRFYRENMKFELSLLVEHFVVHVLEIGPQYLPFDQQFNNSGVQPSELKYISNALVAQQIAILSELKRWFGDGRNDLIEIFLNFDLDYAPDNEGPTRLIPGAQRKTCQNLCGAICNFADIAGETISDQIRDSQVTGTAPISPRSPQSTSSSPRGRSSPRSETFLDDERAKAALIRQGARKLQTLSFETIGSIVKSIAESAATGAGKNYTRLLHSWTSPDISDDNIFISESNDIDDENLCKPPSPQVFCSPWQPMPSPISAFRSPKTPEQAEPLTPTSQNDQMFSYWHNAITPERRKIVSDTLSPMVLSNNNRRDIRSMSPMRKLQSREDDSSISRYGESPERRDSSSRRTAKSEPRIRRKTKASRKPRTNNGSNNQEDLHANAEQILKVAFDIAKNKGLKRCLEHLIACKFMTPSPRDISSFLRIHQNRFDPVMLGDYLGEGGKDEAETDYRNLIRFNYVRAISFVGMNVEQGLRYFLTNCGFRLPGEAQKIDRIMTTFSQCYWEDNAGDLHRCPFNDQDTVFLLSFAIIMLNTDLHKAGNGSVKQNRSIRKKMTKQDFLKNLQGVDSSGDLGQDYLSNIYDSIDAKPIDFINADTDDSRQKEDLSINTGSDGVYSSVCAMLKNVKSTEELLRGMSVHHWPFYSVDDFSKSTLCRNDKQFAMDNLSRRAFRATWHHFHGVINSTLDRAHLDAHGMELALDVLKYSLVTCICLNMHMEKSAFVMQLARFRLFTERRDGNIAERNLTTVKLEDWYKQLEMDSSDPMNQSGLLSALDQIHFIIEDLRASLQVDAGLMKKMNQVTRRIHNGGFLLADPYRSFVREGDLVKKSNRSGRSTTYRFFLFSDYLVYSRKASPTDTLFKIHEELPLHRMKLVDYFPASTKKVKKNAKQTFEIHHPIKSFMVVASSVEEKKSWVLDIRQAIDRERERRIHLEKARLSASMHALINEGRFAEIVPPSVDMGDEEN